MTNSHYRTPFGKRIMRRTFPRASLVSPIRGRAKAIREAILEAFGGKQWFKHLYRVDPSIKQHQSRVFNLMDGRSGALPDGVIEKMEIACAKILETRQQAA